MGIISSRLMKSKPSRVGSNLAGVSLGNPGYAGCCGLSLAVSAAQADGNSARLNEAQIVESKHNSLTQWIDFMVFLLRTGRGFAPACGSEPRKPHP
jgi:hypothetical protein